MQTLKKRVVMDATGRLTMPAEARERLRLEGPIEFIVEIAENAITLKPAVTITIPREDAWAYQPDHLGRLKRALDQAAQGDVVSGSEVLMAGAP